MTQLRLPNSCSPWFFVLLPCCCSFRQPFIQTYFSAVPTRLVSPSPFPILSCNQNPLWEAIKAPVCPKRPPRFVLSPHFPPTQKDPFLNIFPIPAHTVALHTHTHLGQRAKREIPSFDFAVPYLCREPKGPANKPIVHTHTHACMRYNHNNEEPSIPDGRTTSLLVFPYSPCVASISQHVTVPSVPPSPLRIRTYTHDIAARKWPAPAPSSLFHHPCFFPPFFDAVFLLPPVLPPPPNFWISWLYT